MTASGPGQEHCKRQEEAHDTPHDKQQRYPCFILESRALKSGYVRTTQMNRQASSPPTHFQKSRRG